MRFSLLLLEDDESYIEDHASTHFVDGEAIKGRLRLATKSLFFEPESEALPILRFPFSRILQVGETRGRCVVVASEVTQMRKHGKHYPYVVSSRTVEHAFSLDHRTSVEDFLLCVSELLRCSKLPPVQARKSVSGIVARHRDAAKPFNLANLVDLNEELLTDTMCSRIKPFMVQPCRLVVTTKRVYLQPVDDLDGSKYVVELSQVVQVFRRRHSLREIGVELYLKNGKTFFVTFASMSDRDRIFQMIWNHPVVALSVNRDSSEAVTAKWVAGEMSNFDYLMYVNNLADRTRNDLAQYPVFPWVLCEFSEPTLDLTNPKVYRDLSKPIGALNPQRLETYRRRMEDMPQDGQEFLYGTHYSTPGYVLFYLVRKRPDLMLRLQNGKFDAPDRSFFSVAAAWSSCLNSQTDVKELIPEFFHDHSMFENAQNLDLGVRQNGARVGDVELPPWCRNDARKFVELHRQALESEHVSSQLHQWIDLIFGCRQRDKASDNVFYPLTYQGNVDVAAMEDEQLRASFEAQISEFGQTPKQVFFAPHPKRFAKGTGNLKAATAAVRAASPVASQTMQQQQHNDMSPKPLMASKEHLYTSSSLNELLGKSPNIVLKVGNSTSGSVSVDVHSSVADDCSWELDAMRKSSTATLMPRLHRELVSGLDCDGEKLVSVSKDGFVKVHVRSSGELKQTRASNISNVPLACCQLISDDVVLLGCLDSKVYTYSIQFGKSIDSVLAHDDTVSALRYSNNRLVTGGWDTLVRLWNVREDAIQKMAVFEVQELEGSVRCVDLAPNGVFAAASEHNRVVIGDFRIPQKVVRVVDGEDCDPITSIRFLGADTARVLCGNTVLKLAGGSDELVPLFPEVVGAMDVSGSQALVTVHGSKVVELWDCAAGGQKVPFLEKDPVFSKNAERITSIVARGAHLYAATEKGALMWI